MIDVVLLPAHLDAARLPRSQVVILDVLRASTTIVTALANGARDVRLFPDIPSATAAKSALPPPVLLGGERHCVRIEGFDLANSPAEYATERVGGASVLLTTTNGTVAAHAAQAAAITYIAALTNARATALALLERITTHDTLLLCAGTDGRPAVEDLIGAGAILWSILDITHSVALPFTDTAWMAYHTFSATRKMLPAALRLGQGGINLIEAGLEDDIDRCAAMDTHTLRAILQNNIVTPQHP